MPGRLWGELEKAGGRLWGELAAAGPRVPRPCGELAAVGQGPAAGAGRAVGPRAWRGRAPASFPFLYAAGCCGRHSFARHPGLVSVRQLPEKHL